MSREWLGAAGCVAVVATLACGAPTEEAVRYLRFTAVSATLQQLETREVVVELVRPGGAIRVANAVFRSLDSTIVIVSRDGMVHSVGPRGLTEVTATFEDLADTLPIRVVAVADRIAFEPAAPVVPQDSSIAFSAMTLDRAGMPMPELVPTLTVLTPSVITLSGGMIGVVGPELQGAIQAAAGNVWDTVPVRVAQTPTTLVVYPTAMAVREGEQEFLGTYLYDRYGGWILDRPITRTSADTMIAVVRGDVFGISGGQTTITVSVAQFVRQIPVTVVAGSVDAAIRIRLPTPGAATSVASARVLDVPDFPRVFVAVPARDEILQLDWPNWGFTDTLRIGPQPRYLASHELGGQLYAALGGQPALVRINAAASQETGRLLLNHIPAGLVLSPDGARAFILGEDGVLLVVNTGPMTVIDSIAVPAAVDVSVHPTAERLYVAVPDSGLVWVLRSDTLGIESRWIVGGAPRATVPAPARDELYVANDAGRLDILALSTGQMLRSIAVGEPIRSIGLRGEPGDLRVYAVAPSGTIYHIEPSLGTVVCTIAAGGSPGAIRRLADGSVLLVVNAAGWVDFLGFGSRTGGSGC